MVLFIVIAYILLCLGAGLYQPKKKDEPKPADVSEMDDYYSGGRSITGWVVGIVVASTLISGGSMIATPSLIWNNGLSGAIWQNFGMWYGVLGTIVVGKRLAAVGNRIKANSIPEMLGVRFGSATRWATAIFIVILMFAYVSVQYTASARVLQIASGIGYQWCVVIIGVTMLIYLCLGGARAQAWTNVLQSAFMTIGCVAIAYVVLQKFGGIGPLIQEMGKQNPELIKLPGAKGYLPFPLIISMGFIFMFCGGVGQPQAQSRFLLMKKGSPFKPAMLWGGLLISIWYPCMYLAGMAARVMFPEMEHADQAFPKITEALLSPAMVGLTLAGILGATMSSASAMILTVSASITNDIVGVVKPELSMHTMKKYAIFATFFVTGGSIVISLYPPEMLILMSNFAFGALGVAFTPSMLGALFFKGATKAGTLWGSVLGCGFVIFSYIVLGTSAPLGFHAVAWGFIISIVVTYLVSKSTEHSPEEKLDLFYEDGEIFDPARPPVRHTA